MRQATVGKKEKKKCKEKQSVKKSKVGEGAIVYGHFCPNVMPNFSLQFSLHFGEKTFWWARRENT